MAVDLLDVNQFCKKVPIQNYQECAAWITEARRGRRRDLWHGLGAVSTVYLEGYGAAINTNAKVALAESSYCAAGIDDREDCLEYVRGFNAGVTFNLGATGAGSGAFGLSSNMLLIGGGALLLLLLLKRR